MTLNQKGIFDLRLIIGMGVVFFGVALLFKNIDPEIGRDIWRWWPALLILAGLRVMFQPSENRQYLTGGIVGLLGLLLLLNNLDVIELSWGYIWPVVIVLIGLTIIFHSMNRRRALAGDFVNLSIILGGGEYRYDSPGFQGGKVTTIMGGGVVDLRDARPAADEIVIDAMIIMGGLEIRVPIGWQVFLEGTPILGGMDNKTISRDRETGGSGAEGKRLIVRGFAIMGGIEVKN
jgi:hypothetical protein